MNELTEIDSPCICDHLHASGHIGHQGELNGRGFEHPGSIHLCNMTGHARL